MSVIGSNDGRIHVNVDGMSFSFKGITHAEAAAMNRATEIPLIREQFRKKEEKKHSLCTVSGCNNKSLGTWPFWCDKHMPVFLRQMHPCVICNGTGNFFGKCLFCNGKGKIQEKF